MKKVKEEQGLEAANRLWLTESENAKRVASAAIEKQKEPTRITALLVALRAATVKDREKTLHWLERADEEGDPTLFQIKFLTKFDFVRDEKRFQAVVKKLIFE